VDSEPVFLNIDDEYTIKRDAVVQPHLFLDASGFVSLKEKLKSNPEFLATILSGKSTVVISLDEHLPWELVDGEGIYEGLGRFLMQNAKSPEKIYILGISSNHVAQSYLPRENRTDKSFFAYVAFPDKLLESMKPRSVADLFKNDSFETPKGARAYSDSGTAVYNELSALE